MHIFLIFVVYIFTNITNILTIRTLEVEFPFVVPHLNCLARLWFYAFKMLTSCSHVAVIKKDVGMGSLWHHVSVWRDVIFSENCHKITHCAPMEPAASSVCDPNKEFGQPDKKGFNLINNTSWLSWHTFSNRCLTALVRSDVTALVGRDLA